METVADTNFLLRLLLRDDEGQFWAATKRFKASHKVIIPTYVFCEMVWALSYSYKLSSVQILREIEVLIASSKVISRQDEVEAGLDFLRGGGDFADGVIAYMGRQMGSAKAEFVSFDRKAVRLLSERGIAALVP